MKGGRMPAKRAASSGPQQPASPPPGHSSASRSHRSRSADRGGRHVPAWKEELYISSSFTHLYFSIYQWFLILSFPDFFKICAFKSWLFALWQHAGVGVQRRQGASSHCWCCLTNLLILYSSLLASLLMLFSSVIFHFLICCSLIAHSLSIPTSRRARRQQQKYRLTY